MKNYQLSKKETKELLTLYKELLQNIKKLLKEDLDFTSIEEYCASYVYLYKNGYLSLPKTFKENNFYADEILLDYNLLGIILTTGTGVCRNINVFMTDLLNALDCNCYNLILDCVDKYKVSEKILLLYVKLFPKLLGSHVINYIKDNNRSIIFDPTSLDDPFPTLVDNGIIEYNLSKERYLSFFVKENNKGIIMPSLRRQDNQINALKYLGTLKQLDDSKDLLDEFYYENRPLYHEAYIKLETQRQKQLVLAKSCEIKARYK